MSPGLSIAHYRITGKIGEGGMGVVYRALDTRLNREVAIKVLTESLAGDPARMERFEREAQVLASLNHPNIAAIYGVEQGAIVMELVEGEDLKGPVPAATAIEYGRQIAAGLEAAHEKGIVHRDLKPANIKVTHDGAVKILDFGLAKATETTANLKSTQSPTLSLAMTRAGVILGTAAYMAPEQARGKAVDKRADIWAFGVILYELLTGNMLFGGETVSDILAAVLTKEPDLRGAPQRVQTLLAACLQKDPRKRLRDIGDWERLLVDTPAAAARRKSSRAVWLSRALAVCAALVAAGSAWMLKPAGEAPLLQFEIGPPDGTTLGNPDFGQFAVAPDGRSVLFVAHGSDGKQRIWHRRFDSPAAVVMNGTEDGWSPAWSPDGQMWSYVAGGRLFARDLAGRAPQEVGEARGTNTWGANRVIVATSREGLIKYSLGGRSAERAVQPVPGEELQSSAAFLPDGSRFLYQVSGTQGPQLRIAHPNGVAGSPLDAPRMSPAMVVQDGRGRTWLVGNVGTELQARPFDAAREKVEGAAVPLASPIVPGPSWSMSRNGVLIYRKAPKQSHRLVVLDRQGNAPEVLSDAVIWATLRVSPDGRRVAFVREYGNETGVWLLDLSNRTMSRLTLGRDDRSPVWSPDAKILYYSADRGDGTFAVMERAADGSADRVLLSDRRRYSPESVSPDGKYLLLTAEAAGNATGFVLALAGGAPARILDEGIRDPSFSPDGRWIVYSRRKAGGADVFASGAPREAGGMGSAGTWQISKSGGVQPAWRGREIFYITPEGKLVTVAVLPGEGIRVGARVELFDTGINARYTGRNRQYEIMPDGKRIVMRQDVNIGREPPLTVVLNWEKLVR